jgi:hypothetical protein
MDLDEPMRAALRHLADEDGREAARHAPELSALLIAEFRAVYPKRTIARGAYSFGLAMAATLLIAVAGALWIVSHETVAQIEGRDRVTGSGPGARAAVGDRMRPAEVSTAFLPLPYASIPTRDAQVVRIVVPRTALGAFGLLPVDATGSDVTGTVVADVIVGEDGLARAVRFVRAPLARTE